MNVVIWARVSSREQKEGYSIDAQLRATRDKAREAGWEIAREFVVAESAKRGAERVVFKEMLKWVRANARRARIHAILSHKLDRVCRNMRDAVRLQELEDDCGVRLCFVENQFGPGAAGALSFNVMAAVAQYYSDNLRTEVLKGMDEKVRQGWPTGLAPFGYINVPDNREEPVQPDPERSKTLFRIFELYAPGNLTIDELRDRLYREGHYYRSSQLRFPRTVLSYILNNRFYVGELRRNGQVHQGRYRLVIDRAIFNACQAVLNGRKRRTSNRNTPLAGGLFRCHYCGQAITGEKIQRRLSDGSVREHMYYRCANNAPGPDHPTVRWRLEDLEAAVVKDLTEMTMPSPELGRWFHHAIQAAFSDVTTHQKRQAATLAKRHAELKGMQDRLLNAYLGGTVEEGIFKAKTAELKAEMATVAEAIDRVGAPVPTDGDGALEIFEWSQNAADVWRRSNNARKRDILDFICLNRALSDVSLYTVKRKPFDVLEKSPKFAESRGDWI
jgi:site-specific DNA recombinase